MAKPGLKPRPLGCHRPPLTPQDSELAVSTGPWLRGLAVWVQGLGALHVLSLKEMNICSGRNHS